MSAVLDAIKENLRQIKLIFDVTEASFTGDTGQTADAREVSVKEFLECFLPNSFQVKKGLIHSTNGKSNEIDCVILAPNHPRLITPVRQVILAEGVFAAVEVKPDISTLTNNSEFFRGLGQIKSVKNLIRSVADLSWDNPLPENFVENGFKNEIDLKIPSVIFSNRSRKQEDIIDYLLELIKQGAFKPEELPDLIVTMDKGIIFHTSCGSKSVFRNLIPPNAQVTTDRFFLFFPIIDTETILAQFLTILHSFTPPEPFFSDPILKKYLDLKIPGFIRQY